MNVDLATAYLCRLIQHLDAHGLGVAVARDVDGSRLDESVMGNLTSGYVQRGGALLTRQGRKLPWRVTHHYPTDKAQLLRVPIDDGVLTFEAVRTEASVADDSTRRSHLV